MYRIFFFGLGLLCASWGIVFNIVYLALFDFGYSFQDYFNYIKARPEVYFFPIGLLVMILVFTWPKKSE